MAAQDGDAENIDCRALSEAGRAIYPLLTALSVQEAVQALDQLPAAIQASLDSISPLSYAPQLQAPLIFLFHDRHDPVIPVGETRRLRSYLAGRSGLRYTEFSVFQHLDPTKGQPALLPLIKELGRFFLALYPMFRQTTV